MTTVIVQSVYSVVTTVSKTNFELSDQEVRIREELSHRPLLLVKIVQIMELEENSAEHFKF